MTAQAIAQDSQVRVAGHGVQVGPAIGRRLTRDGFEDLIGWGSVTWT